jgi:hypothetical protein
MRLRRSIKRSAKSVADNNNANNSAIFFGGVQFVTKLHTLFPAIVQISDRIKRAYSLRLAYT